MKRDLSQSQQYRQEAEALIPCITQTFSKAPTAFVQGVSPIYAQRADGCRIYDVDGNEYLDFIMGLGAVSLGYSYQAVNQAVSEFLQHNHPILSLPHPLEVEVAKLLVDMIPSAEMVRYGKNGSDVTAAAVRLARAYSGKEIILSCGYHGWQDWYVAATSRDLGVPDCLTPLTLKFDYNDLEGFKALFEANKDNVAGVIMEPAMLDAPEPGFLESIRTITEEAGVVLIFDEMVTGFRFAPGGAQELFDITPDLSCFGKAIANGFPLAALVGKKEIMSLCKDVFFSFTFGGEIVSLLAGLKTLQILKEEKVGQYMWKLGQRFKDEFNQLVEKHNLNDFVSCNGFPPRTSLIFSATPQNSVLVVRSWFQQEAIKAGILFNGDHFISYSHTEADINLALEVYDKILSDLSTRINQNEDLEPLLAGDVVRPVFQKRVPT